MRVLLLEVGCRRQEYNEPLGIEAVAGALQHHEGIRAELSWSKVGDDPDLSTLSSNDVLGASLQIDSLERFEGIYQRFVALERKPHLVLGNLLPTYAPAEVLARFPEAVCVLSEGESTFQELCALWRACPDAFPSSIPNLAYLDADWHLVATERRLERLDGRLDRPVRGLIPHVLALGGIARVEASRGCHWGRCEFCSVAERHGTGVWRPFDIDWIVRELEDLSASGVRSPYFADEDFFGRDYERSGALADAIIAGKVDGRIDPGMNFFISMLASDIHSPPCAEALRRWKKAGLREVFIGVESGDNVQLRRYGKKARDRANTDAVSWARQLGLQIDIGSIMFDPRVTLAQLRRNVTFLDSLSLEGCDSRVVKALRIQPLTGCTVSYSDSITGPLELSSLTYPYAFADERVGEVWDTYRAWAAPHRERVDSLLAAARGEVPSEGLRLKIKSGLATVRDTDLEAVSQLIQQVEHNDAPTLSQGLFEEKEKRLVMIEQLAENSYE